MAISAELDALHAKAKKNKWMGYFTTFTRLAFVAGFLPSGYVCRTLGKLSSGPQASFINTS
ncbi:MAG: hypothetical protein V4708_08600 [Bacteroidota bacterium]